MSAKSIRRALIGGVVLFVGIQFVPVDRTNPPVVTELEAPDPVLAVLRRACYDCHSHETRWPWYSRVAPMAWLVADHVHEGRGDLNFSEWPAFDFEEVEEAGEDIRKQVEKGKMPLPSYLLLHPEARLSEADRRILIDWTRGL